MQKELNNTVLGFTSMNDLFKTLVIGSNFKANCFAALICSLTGFITKYVYDDAKAVYFMLFLLVIDFLTGIWKAVKNKNFTSARLPRILLTTIIYSIMLSISWNAAIHSPALSFLPGLIYGGLISTLLVSIAENFSQLGYFPKNLLNSLKKRLLKN